MHKRRPTALRIGISRRGITLLGIVGRLRRHAEVLCDLRMETEGPALFDEMAAHLDSAVRDAKCSGMRTAVVIADDLARFFMVTPPHNGAHLEDCRAAASLRFHMLYGEPAESWQLAADWSFRVPFLACALPRVLLEAIRSAAGAHRLTLMEVVPQFIAAWNGCTSSLRKNAWFGVAHGDVLTLGAMKDEQLLSVRTASIPEECRQDRHWLAQYLSREALRLNLDAPHHLQLCGDLPDHWIAQPDGGLTCERIDAALHRIAGIDSGARRAGALLAGSGARL